MLVTAVGMRTRWVKSVIGGDGETTLRIELNGVETIMGKIGLLFAMVTFAVLVLKFFGNKKHETSSWPMELLKYLSIAGTVAVVTIPEGLPLAVKMNLGFAIKKMMKNKACVRHLVVCETIGSIATICSDKTGILTTNEMCVVKSCICMNVKNSSNVSAEILDSALKILHESIFNNTDGEVVVDDGKCEILGTPTDTAMLKFGLLLGGDFLAERNASKVAKVHQFDPTTKQRSVVLELPGSGFRSHTVGPFEIILDSCENVVNWKGEVVPLDTSTVNYLKATSYRFSNDALQTFCLAYKELENDEAIPTSGYTCIGILGIEDPIKLGVRESVALCQSAGVTVRMITGDDINTAKAIARRCGILTDDGIAIEGPVFCEKSLDEIFELIPNIQVMACSSPKGKNMLVKHLRSMFNEVMAVIGYGAYDVPALREADVGLAMGIAGTLVAKESADFIILDEDFSTIVTAAKWGRSIYANIQKFVQFQLTVNVFALVLDFTSACLTGTAPLTAVQLLTKKKNLL